jgi:hypothetical protein
MLREETDSRILRLTAKVWRKLFRREQWFLQVEQSVDASLMPELQRCVPIYPPPDRFWADPFVWSTPEAHFIFVEELLFSTRKGHIAVLELARDGTLGGVQRVRKVLERPYHLSYPFLFHWDGALYMLPESGQNRTVELYRCIVFPDQWVQEKVLLSGVNSADATLVEHEGRWWMFMTQAESGQSIHEHLYLYSAETPLGPFTPHPGNPVKSGLRGSRPAGALFSREGMLYRPTQDCSRVYGEAVVLQRVDELTSGVFHETEVGRMASEGHSEVRRLHTMNAGEGIRVMDALRWIAK